MKKIFSTKQNKKGTAKRTVLQGVFRILRNPDYGNVGKMKNRSQAEITA